MSKISNKVVKELDRKHSLSDREIVIIKEAVRTALAINPDGKITLPVTGFWMRNNVRDGFIEILVEHDGKWIRVFGPDGPGPAARDLDQNIDHMVHAGGIRNLLDYGTVHPPIRGRKTGKPDRRATERRATKRRTGDKLEARLAARKR
jgi:hypothetical protein